MDGVTLKVVDHIAAIPQASWDSLGGPEDTPFTSWSFLEALEASGSAVPETGWWPRHLGLWRGVRLIAAAPAYVKRDSAGDFSRDWGWADAATRAGLRYYPKLVLGVPFSPVPGPRIRVAAGEDVQRCTAAVLAGAAELARSQRLSSVHVLFSTPAEVGRLEALGLFSRVLVQYHWFNRDFATLEDWLASLRSKRRTQIRRERSEMGRLRIGLRTVRDEELRNGAGEWAARMYTFYRTTCDRYYWGHTYLNEGFFARVFERMSAQVEVVAAEREGSVIAGAFNVVGNRRLYGRNWGAIEDHPFLHFNVCLYHSIDACIARGIQVFEGGMGGEHKMWRGFEPTLVESAHLFLDPRFDEAVRQHCRQEKQVRLQELLRWREEAASR